jgi:hypothetical protein
VCAIHRVDGRSKGQRYLGIVDRRLPLTPLLALPARVQDRVHPSTIAKLMRDRDPAPRRICPTSAGSRPRAQEQGSVETGRDRSGAHLQGPWDRWQASQREPVGAR